MQKSPAEIYTQNIEQLKVEIAQYRTKIITIAWIRTAIVLAGSAAIYFLWGMHVGFIALAVVLTLAGFLGFVRYHLDLKDKRRHLEAVLSINELELKALSGDSSGYPNGDQFVNPNHPYTFDLDIFDDGSIYQFLVRCGTLEGRRALAKRLQDPELDIATIKERQAAVKEIADKLKWRQDFYAYGLLSGENDGDKDRILTWMKSKDRLMNGFYNAMRFVLPALSIAATVLWIMDYMTFMQLVIFSALPFGVIGTRVKAVNALTEQLSKNHELISNYAGLIQSIEDLNLKSSELLRLQNMLKTDELRASQQFNSLSAIINAFESRNNVIMGVLLNFLLAWDIQCLHRIEKWQDQFASEATQWFDAIAEFEVYSSLGNLHYNKPHFTFAEPDANGPVLQLDEAGHPLLSADDCVNNSFGIKNQGDFAIVTGANMAGKSTFLRTVGVNLVLAMAGAPVNAKQLKFRPVTMYSSMRTSDSLQKNQSYFHSELLRLKALVDHLQTGAPTFIILDEILKGTNSKDKASGSKAFVDRMIGLKASGIIATHDLSLCELENKYPEQVQNNSFEVDIEGDQMVCDYKLRDGICQNMNATFLMENMGITKELPVKPS